MRATSKFQLEPILNSRNVHQRPSARSGQSAAPMSRLRREEVAAALRDVPSTMVPRSIRSIHCQHFSFQSKSTFFSHTRSK